MVEVELLRAEDDCEVSEDIPVDELNTPVVLITKELVEDVKEDPVVPEAPVVPTEDDEGEEDVVEDVELVDVEDAVPDDVVDEDVEEVEDDEVEEVVVEEAVVTLLVVEVTVTLTGLTPILAQKSIVILLN